MEGKVQENTSKGESGTETVDSLPSLLGLVSKPDRQQASSFGLQSLDFLLPDGRAGGPPMRDELSHQAGQTLQPGDLHQLDRSPYAQMGLGYAFDYEEPSPRAESSQQDQVDLADGAHARKMQERKVELNRRAQAKFRQRKKDKFLELQGQHDELSSRLECAVQERQDVLERNTILQMMEKKDQDNAVLKIQTKEHIASAELTDAFWEMVLELKRGKPGLMGTQESVIALVNAMLNWGSLELGFIRREVVGQLIMCLAQGGEREETPANLWLGNLVAAYNKLVHRCGECHPLAFRTFLSLQLPEQTGVTVDPAFWRKILEAGGLTMWQTQQLVSAHAKLSDRMQQLKDRRSYADPTQDQTARDAPSHHFLLDMAQAKDILDLHARILKEMQAAVFDFHTAIGLVLEPVQQAKLMVASFPFALDTLAICSVLESMDSPAGDKSFLSKPPLTPFS